MEEDKVKVTHWWPDRQWLGTSPIPEWLIKKATQRGSRYLTYATFVNGPMIGESGISVYGFAFCCPKDFPRRRIGRDIAVGRLYRMREIESQRT